jgi:4-hydroxy-tetrahydrodipicolinate synthase
VSTGYAGFVAGDLDLRGVWVPLITPFAADGSVDLDAIERLCNEYLDAGVAGIVALGTTGEPTALDATEKQAVVDTCARVCAARGAPLIIGTGTNSTAATISATQAIEGTPALVAALVVVPYYVRPSEAGIVEHFKAVAAASSVPLVVYNIPYRTGRALGSASLLELAATDNIVGLKQSVGALDVDTLAVLRGAPRGFHVLSGEDSILFPMVLMGAYGGISAPAHVCTARFVEMVECGLAGKLDDGRAHAEALLPVVQAGFVEPNPAVWKGVLHAQGKIASPALRLPMTAASQATIDGCLAAIELAGRAR